MNVDLSSAVESFTLPANGCAWTMIDVDYAQIELRVMAELSGDEVLMEAFRQKRDLHSWTGALVEAYLQYGQRALEDADLRVRVYEEVMAAKRRAKAGQPLSDRDVKLLARRSHGKCFHPDTEALTPRGWVRILDLRPDDEVAQAWPIQGQRIVELEWTLPDEVKPLRHPSGKLVLVESDTVSMSLTPDHRCSTWRGPHHDVVTPSTIGPHDEVMVGGVLPGIRQATASERAWLRVAVAVQADGSYRPDGGIDISFKKERKIARFPMLMREAGVDFVEYERRANGYVAFNIPAAPAERIRDELLGEGKTLPWWWLEYDAETRAVILDELPHWDSGERTETGGFRYSSKHQQCVDVVQAIAVSVGRRARVSDDRVWYRAAVGGYEACSHSHMKVVSTEAFDGDVACIAVPSTFLLCRFRGTTFVSGQTLNFALLYGAGDDSIAVDIGVTLAEAHQIVRAIMMMYGGMTAYLERTRAEMREHPRFITLGGRHRTIPEYLSTDAGELAKADRLNDNQRCQAGARDVIMGAMIQIDVDIEAGGGYGRRGRGTYGHWLSDGSWRPDFSRLPKGWAPDLPPALRNNLGMLGRVGARVVIQLHDELGLVTPTAYAGEVKDRVVSLMEDPWGNDLKFRVPIVAEGREGHNWLEAKGKD